MDIITPIAQQPAYRKAFDETLPIARKLGPRQFTKAMKAAQLYANQGHPIRSEEAFRAIGTVDAYRKEEMRRAYEYLDKRREEKARARAQKGQ